MSEACQSRRASDCGHSLSEVDPGYRTASGLLLCDGCWDNHPHHLDWDYTVKIQYITDQRDTVTGNDPQDLIVQLYRKYNNLDPQDAVDFGKVIDWVANVSFRANSVAGLRKTTMIYHQAPPIAWLTDMLGAGYIHTLSYLQDGDRPERPSNGVWV